ncbi:tRNA-guanine transglycosylase [Halosimplex halophilum]|uniref:tRNA-guanine transglycosylase n=1 Tax=Halosimplex halophilum TaxID=2559572 RepID=UPI001AE1BA8D|nr:tRNA-guanine transglycosylase [Halosimplex halophilum]
MTTPANIPQSGATSYSSFSVTATTGKARAAKLEIDETTLNTPNLLPVINFYAGGMERSLYGGGIFRTMKEFMTGQGPLSVEACEEYFDAVMMSVASLTDYGINKERYEAYLDTPIKQREIFSEFDGALFVDSGGYKLLDEDSLDGSDFEVNLTQQTIFDIQRRLGGDILVNLDRPISPDDGYETRVKKAEQTAENMAEFLRYSADYNGARFLTIHGYNYSMMDTFLEKVTDVLGPHLIRSCFDGIALGSLVPKKDNKGDLISAVSDCKEVLTDYRFDELPLHVLGISSSAIPLLVAMGVDSFDSSSYLHAAINGKYHTDLTKTVSVDDAPIEDCPCPVCSNPKLSAWMRGDAEYQKDKLGAVSMHNLIIQKDSIREMREIIRQDDRDALIEYIDSTIGQRKSMRQFAHRVINESLGGYF